MKLPTIEHPTFEEEVPSTGHKILIRPLLVKEEKLLLIAQQSGEERDIIRALKQVIENCIVAPKDFNTDNLALFDIEYLFIRLRSRSIDNMVNVSVKDEEDDISYDFQINLDEIKVTFPENTDKKIVISETVGIVMKYPTAGILNNLGDEISEEDLLSELILNGIDCIYNGDDVFYVNKETKDDISQFLDNLEIDTYNKIREFFKSLPKLSYVLKYENSKGNTRTFVLDSLRDFFTWDSYTAT